MLSAKILKGWNILVVDDDPKSLKMMEILLMSYGVMVEKAENGKEALEKVKQFKPQLILSDLSMPVMDGWEMVRTLKAEEATSDIPVIALTAHAMAGDRDKAIAAGCHDYMTKPIIPATFFTHLLGLLTGIPELEPLLKAVE
jgi:two-component system, cell cycle response regulator DivK